MPSRSIMTALVVATLVTAAPAFAEDNARRPQYASGNHMWFSIKAAAIRFLGGVPAVSQEEIRRAKREGWWGESVLVFRHQPTVPATLAKAEGDGK